MAASPERRIIFTGPRDWGAGGEERLAAARAVDEWGNRGYVIVQGGAKGLDRLVLEACITRGYRHETVHAEWEKFGKRAGHVRNTKMLTLPNVERCIGFRYANRDWTRGTGNCVASAKQLNIPVIEVVA